MTDRTGIFAGNDPFAVIEQWMAEATETEVNDPNAIALSTVDADGLPNVRIVLLKEIESDGNGDGAFLFYTNYESRKAEELDGAGRAAFVLYWKSLHRQIRVRGLISREDGAKADAYYNSRSLESRIGAWASVQSRPLESREALEAQVAAAESAHGTSPSRPPFWGGFRLRPTEIEFWADGAHRLHNRFRWSRSQAVGSEWTVVRLNP